MAEKFRNRHRKTSATLVQYGSEGQATLVERREAMPACVVAANPLDALSQVQCTDTHNSYHLAPDVAAKFLRAVVPNEVTRNDYSHIPQGEK